MLVYLPVMICGVRCAGGLLRLETRSHFVVLDDGGARRRVVLLNTELWPRRRAPDAWEVTILTPPT